MRWRSVPSSCGDERAEDRLLRRHSDDRSGEPGQARRGRRPDAGPSRIVIADDRPDPASPLNLPATSALLVVVRSYGGPAAARNAGWRGTESEWVAFLDDDVTVPADWCARLVRDLGGLPDHVGASQARLQVTLPPGQRPTDEQRRTTGLVGAQWITADMAYRRSALLATGGSTSASRVPSEKMLILVCEPYGPDTSIVWVIG